MKLHKATVVLKNTLKMLVINSMEILDTWFVFFPALIFCEPIASSNPEDWSGKI